MPMLDLQKRWAESYRIRLGEKRTSAKGTEYPAALDGKIRVTSRSPQVIDAIVRVYGGTIGPWEDQTQAVLPTDHLRIVVLPGLTCVGWWEQWRRRDGGMPVCTHRCDGQRNYQTGGPCTCPPLAERLEHRDRWCQPTTRLWVMLPDVEVIGAGRLESYGVIAAETLPQSVGVLQHTLERGELVPAVLRVRRVESSGRSFVVPEVEVTGVSLDSLIGPQESLAPPVSDVAPERPARRTLGAASPSLPPSPSSDEGEGEPAAPASCSGQGSPAAATVKQMNAIRAKLARRQVTDNDEVHRLVGEWLGREIRSLKELSHNDVSEVLEHA